MNFIKNFNKLRVLKDTVAVNTTNQWILKNYINIISNQKKFRNRKTSLFEWNNI